MSGRGVLYLARQKLPGSLNLRPCDLSASSLRERIWATKIGMTESPNHASAVKRVAAMNTGNPFELYVFKSISCKDANLWEKYWHKKYAAARVHKEWHYLIDDQCTEIIDTIQQGDENGVFPDDPLFHEIFSVAPRNESKPSLPKKGERKSDDDESLIVTSDVVRDIRKKHEALVIMHDGIRSYLDPSEFEILLAVLENHPDAETKIGVGVAHIFVAEANFNSGSSFCFHVERLDGSEEDFSYLYCFGKPRRRSWYTHQKAPTVT